MPELHPTHRGLRAVALGLIVLVGTGCTGRGTPLPPPENSRPAPAVQPGADPEEPATQPGVTTGTGQDSAPPGAPTGTPSSARTTLPSDGFLAAQPLPPGCGGGPRESRLPGPPGAVVAPAWQRGGNTPFPTRYAHRSGCRFATGGSALLVTLYLPRDAREAEARQALRVRGAAPEAIDWSPQDAALLLRFPPGPPGQQIRIQLQGPPGPALPILDFQVELVREFPTVTASVRRPPAENWQPLRPWEVHPPGPLDLRLAFDRPVSQAEAESRLRRTQSLIQAEWRWVDPQTLIVQHPKPPPVLVLDLGGLPGPGGIGLYGPPVVLRTGTPPVATALNPTTAEETILATVPAEVERAALDATGRWLAVTAAVPSAAPPWTEEQSWAIDLRSGQWVMAPFSEPFISWHPVQGLLGAEQPGSIVAWHPDRGQSATYSVSANAHYLNLSPDGRYLAGVRIHEERLDPVRQIMPVDLLILDLATGREHVVPEWAHYWPGPGQWAAPLPLAWTQDGTGLVGRTYLGPDLWDWVIFDRKSGERRILPADVAAGLNLAAPSPKGPQGWEVQQGREWEAVILRDTRGQSRSLGPGLPAGWLPDGRLVILRRDQ